MNTNSETTIDKDLNLASFADAIDTTKMNETERFNYEVALSFANAQIQRLRDANATSSTSVEVTSFSTVSKTQLLNYLKAPKNNEKSIRNASIMMYHGSSHYKRLISYYALMPTWAYIIRPTGFDVDKLKDKTFKASYHKAAVKIDSMNLKHEMQKVLTIGLREGVFYGAIWETNDSFFIQRINPDICQLTSIVDGTWLYSVDMSKIKETDLPLYPAEFTTMYSTYKSTGVKWQEVPPKITFCFKADETTISHSLPPWSSSMPLILDIEGYKALQETAGEISNYKLLNMEIPLDSNNAPKFSFELARQYYDLMCSVLPPFVGAVMSPMKVTDFNFDNSGSLRETDIVSRAERQFWQNSGSSSLLFGDAANTTAGALKLSIKADEELVFGWVNQCERIVNRLLKTISGTQKFKITFLPVTIFNLAEMVDLYKNAASLGIPTKSAYASTLGVNTIDIPGVDYIEREVLGMDKLVPLISSYNSGASDNDSGRPEVDDENLSESGIASRENNNE